MDPSWINNSLRLLESIQSTSKFGYKYVTVNHSKEFYNESNAACTNAIESDWRHAKCAMPKYRIHKGMHAGYLAAFLWFQKYDGHDKFITLIEKTNYYFQKGLLGLIST